MSEPQTERVPIREAAERMGVSVDSIRRRLCAGEIEGEKSKAAQGFDWLVDAPVIEKPEGTAAASPEIALLKERVVELERVVGAKDQLVEDLRRQRGRLDDEIYRLRVQLDAEREAAHETPVLHAQSLPAPRQPVPIEPEATMRAREEPEEFEDFLARQSRQTQARQERRKNRGLFGWLRRKR